MATATIFSEAPDTFADLLQRLGDIPLNRIRMHPPPGTATEKDVIAAEKLPRKRLCELVDGVLVEKAIGAKESMLTMALAYWLSHFLRKHDFGVLLGADAALRLLRGLIRIPDLSFISWDQLPGRELPDTPIPSLVPDLAVEYISKSNTPQEMARKLHDYFTAGVQLVWYVYPRKRTVEVYTGPHIWTVLKPGQKLDGGEVLPGFSLPVKQLFSLPKGKAKKEKRK